MKKILFIMLAIILSGCISTNTDQNQKTPEPAPEITYDFQTTLPDDWIAYDISLQYEKEAYDIDHKLLLSFFGEKREEPYCQGPCMVYETITANDNHLTSLEQSEIRINDQYGTLTLYNLNDELYLINFNYAAQFNSSTGLVIDSKGNIIMEYNGADLTMNEIYQNQFGLNYYDPETNESIFEVYTANGNELSMEIR